MAQRESRVIKSQLSRKGFQEDDRHHVYLTYKTLDGKKSDIKTRLSQGSNKTIQSRLLGKMARQCHLNINHFLRLVDCDLEQDEYEQHLRDNYKI